MYDYRGLFGYDQSPSFFAVAMVRNEIPALADRAKHRGGDLLSKVSPFLPHPYNALLYQPCPLAPSSPTTDVCTAVIISVPTQNVYIYVAFIVCVWV